METIRFIDLFAGIGGIRIPFDELGYKCVFSSEWDKAACDTYEANFGERPSGDITKIAASDIPRHNILLGGFPCQAFSIMGKMQGFADTRGTMFFEIERILKHHRTPYILLENVKQLVGHDGGRTFKVILERLDQLDTTSNGKCLTPSPSDCRRNASVSSSLASSTRLNAMLSRSTYPTNLTILPTYLNLTKTLTPRSSPPTIL